MVAHLGPAAGRREDRRRGLALHVGVLGAHHSPGPQQQRGARARAPGSRRGRRPRRTARGAGRGRAPRAPPTPTPRAGCTAGCRPPRRRCRRGRRRRSAKSPCRRSTPVPARLRSAQRCAGSSSSTACTPGVRHLVGDAPWRSPRSRCTGRPRPGRPPARPRPARPPSRPAARSRAGARRRPARPPARRGGSTRAPVRCCSGSRAARRATRASYAAASAAVTSSTSGSRDGSVPSTWASSSAASCSGLATPAAASRGGGVGEQARRARVGGHPARGRRAGRRGRPRCRSRGPAGGRRRAPGRGCRTCSRCGGRRCGSPGSCRCGSARSGRPCGPGCAAPRSASASASSWAAASSRARRIRIACSLFCSWLFSFWQLATMPVGTWHFDEVKAVSNLTGSSKNLGQVAQYGRAISEVNAASGGMRALGNTLRGGGLVLGAAGVGIDGYLTYNQINQQLTAGNMTGAGLSGAQFAGRQVGGLGLGAAGALGGVAAWSLAVRRKWGSLWKRRARHRQFRFGNCGCGWRRNRRGARWRSGYHGDLQFDFRSASHTCARFRLCGGCGLGPLGC